MKQSILFIFLVLSHSLFATIPILISDIETAPIYAGYDTSDDSAIWVNKINPSESLIIGVSKNQDRNGGMGGAYVYDLEGNEKQFLSIGRLNNIDLKYDVNYKGQIVDVVVGSHRDLQAISLMVIDPVIKKLTTLYHHPLLNLRGKPYDPYGICAHHSKKTGKLYTFVTTKLGNLYQYELISSRYGISFDFVGVINLGNYVSDSDEAMIRYIIMEDLKVSNETGEYEHELEERYILEACVSDDETDTLFVGMELLGVFRLDISDGVMGEPKLVVKIGESKYHANRLAPGYPRLTDDVEGLALYKKDNINYVLVSAQGLNEFAVFINNESFDYVTSFKANYKGYDPITETDGLSVTSQNLGPKYPNGIMVMHDHMNQNPNGDFEFGNYKMIDFNEVLKILP